MPGRQQRLGISGCKRQPNKVSGEGCLHSKQHAESASRHRAYGLGSQSRVPVFDSVHVLTPPKSMRMVRLRVSRAIRVLSNITCIEPERERPAEPDMLESDDD